MVPFLRVHEETVLNCCAVFREVVEEEDCRADIRGVGGGEELDICVVAIVVLLSVITAVMVGLVITRVPPGIPICRSRSMSGEGVFGVWGRLEGLLDASDGLLLEDIAR